MDNNLKSIMQNLANTTNDMTKFVEQMMADIQKNASPEQAKKAAELFKQMKVEESLKNATDKLKETIGKCQ